MFLLQCRRRKERGPPHLLMRWVSRRRKRRTSLLMGTRQSSQRRKRRRRRQRRGARARRRRRKRRTRRMSDIGEADLPFILWLLVSCVAWRCGWSMMGVMCRNTPSERFSSQSAVVIVVVQFVESTIVRLCSLMMYTFNNHFKTLSQFCIARFKRAAASVMYLLVCQTQ